jgi:hypothetical protein
MSGALALQTKARPVRADTSVPAGRRASRAGFDGLAGRPHAVRERVHRPLGTRFAQTRTLAAADGAVNVRYVGLLGNPDLDSNRARRHAQRAATFGTSRPGPPEASASQRRFGFRTVANGPCVSPRLGLHHPAHVGHATATAAAILLWNLGDDRLGREDVLGDRRGILQRRARDHRRVDDALLD